MKRIILLITLLSISVITFSQDSINLNTKDYYLQRSKKEAKTGWILIGVGTATTVVGLSLPREAAVDGYNYAPTGKDIISMVVIVAGLSTNFVGTLFLINAIDNKNRAAKVSVGNQNIYLPEQKSSALRSIPSIRVTINF